MCKFCVSFKKNSFSTVRCVSFVDRKRVGVRRNLQSKCLGSHVCFHSKERLTWKRECVKNVFLCVSFMFDFPKLFWLLKCFWVLILVQKREAMASMEASMNVAGDSTSMDVSSPGADPVLHAAAQSPPEDQLLAKASETSPPQEGSAAGAAPQETVVDKETVTCRRCTLEVQKGEAICTPKFREDLRWTCKSCHAVKGQLTRHGIELSSCLSEDDIVVFYQDARAERLNSVDHRLSYSQARGVLKKSMIVSSSRVDKEGERGEYHPLSYWELQGYNTARIEELADSRTHPILGETYRVDITSKSTEFITKVVEERLLRMESELQQRQRRAAAGGAAGDAAQGPPLQLDLPTVMDQVESGKKRKTPEEKKAQQEADKMQRQEDKNPLKLEATAVAAAGKLLPQLQKCTARLEQAMSKINALGTSMPSALEEKVGEAKTALDHANANASKMLQVAAKGQRLNDMPAEALPADKDLQRVLKDTNETIRSMQQFVREEKENVAPKKAARGKGKQ